MSMTHITQPIENKEIRGVTLKLFYAIFASLIIGTSTATFYYFNLRQGQKDNGNSIQVTNESIKVIVEEAKERTREQKLQNDSFQEQLEQLKIQTVIIETRLGIQSPYLSTPEVKTLKQR